MPNAGEDKKISSPLIIALGAALLIFLALATQHFFPTLTCPIKAQWNIDCPGCGGTRAAQSLLAGNIPQALSHNLLITIGIILIAGYCLFCLIYRFMTGKTYLFPFSLHIGVACLLIIIAFTIVRNL